MDENPLIEADIRRVSQEAIHPPALKLKIH
jgi:hypothetical protein